MIKRATQLRSTQGLALARFKAWITLANHIHLAMATNHFAVTMAGFSGF
jgi:hypothetical protein